MPHRASILQDWPDHGDVETQQVVLPGARTFQLLEKVQSRCRLKQFTEKIATVTSMVVVVNSS